MTACIPTLLWLGAVASLVVNWQDVTGWLRYAYLALLILALWTAATARTAFRQALADRQVADPLLDHLDVEDAKHSHVLEFWTKANIAVTLVLVGLAIYAFFA